MTGWPWARRAPKASEEADSAVERTSRALVDAQNFDTRASHMSDRLTETLRRNHFAAAVAKAMRGA